MEFETEQTTVLGNFFSITELNFKNIKGCFNLIDDCLTKSSNRNHVSTALSLRS